MTRASRHADLRAWFAGRSDVDLQALVDAAPVVGRGVGGVHRVVEVLGGPVFVKQVPLTELELAHPRSTANLWDLPPEMHWGVRTVGFGAWRELAANLTATSLFADARCLAVPLLHDWRVLDPPPAGPPVQLDDDVSVETLVAEWEGVAGVGARLRAVLDAPATVTMFLEHVPLTVEDWYAARCRGDDDTFAEAYRGLVVGLSRAVGELVMNGVRHHDAHLANALTTEDGSMVVLADLGLAACETFDLDDAERDFLARTELHDLAYVLSQLVNATVRHRTDLPDVADRFALVRDLAAGGPVPAGLAPIEEVLLGQVRGVAAFNAWWWEVHGRSRRPHYPAEEIRRAFEQGPPR